MRALDGEKMSFVRDDQKETKGIERESNTLEAGFMG